MRNKEMQMSMFDIYTDVSDSLENNKPKFFELMEEYICWDEIVPESFYYAFYKSTGRDRYYSLDSFIAILILQRVFGYTEDSQLLNTLRFSKEMRDFCGLKKVPHASQLTRFKQTFTDELKRMLAFLVDLTEPICKEINAELADCLVFDTTGIESYVAENNPKFMASVLKQAKSIAKIDPNFNPYTGMYRLLPSSAASNPAVKQQYINGHFCYAQKAAIVTNALGIVRHVSFFDEDFKEKHPNMLIEKRSDNPDIDKEIGDSTSLKPVLQDFFSLHPQLNYKTFLGDSSFDSYDNYKLLLKELHFDKAIIPLNLRNSAKASSVEFDEHGRPLCPQNGDPMTYLAKCGGKNRSVRLKWVCPKSKQVGTTRVCSCENPCTSSSYGRCVYTYPDKNLRLYPGIGRDSEAWIKFYKSRVTVERSISSLKYSFCLTEEKQAILLLLRPTCFLLLLFSSLVFFSLKLLAI